MLGPLNIKVYMLSQFLYICLQTVSVNVLFHLPPSIDTYQLQPSVSLKLGIRKFAIALYNLPVRRSFYVLKDRIFTGFR